MICDWSKQPHMVRRNLNWMEKCIINFCKVTYYLFHLAKENDGYWKTREETVFSSQTWMLCLNIMSYCHCWDMKLHAPLISPGRAFLVFLKTCDAAPDDHEMVFSPFFIADMKRDFSHSHTVVLIYWIKSAIMYQTIHWILS